MVAGQSDVLQFWDGNDYKNVWLCGNPAPAFSSIYHKWANAANYGTGWGIANQACQHKIKGGESFWIKRYFNKATQKASDLPAKTITVSGQVIVAATGEKEFDINPGTGMGYGYTLISSAFTAPFALNPDKVDPSKDKVDWAAMGCYAGMVAGASDCIQYWDGNDYQNFWLCGNPAAAFSASKGYWCNAATYNPSTAIVNQPTTIQIDPTKGFWYKRHKTQTSSFKFKIPQPYTLGE